MNPLPTGHVVRDGDRRTLVFTRTFPVPIDDVWASVTQPARLERWIGTFTGDPLSGSVLFRMTAEGEQHQAQRMHVTECDPPRRLALVSELAGQTWYLNLDLREDGGVTTVTFSQPDIDPGAIPDVGPGWDYYLDRWLSALTGGDVDAHDFERDYYPALKGHYEEQLGD